MFSLKMIDLPEITLVGIDSINPDRTILVMRFTMRFVRFARAVVVTKEPVEERLLHGIENIVYPMDGTYAEYRRIEAREMIRFFDTPFALRQHWDSLIVNPEAWNMDWLKWDYIGAPWPFPRQFEGYPLLEKHNCVGNGGFTLISKRLADATSELTPESFDKSADRWICLSLRDKLADRGIKIAPYEVARQFAVEDRVVSAEFGMHGKASLKLNGINLEALRDILIP